MGWVLHRQINKIWILHDFENDLNILEYPFWNVPLFSYPSLWMGVVIIGIQLYIYFLVWPRKIWPDYLGGRKYGQGVGNVNANGEYCWKGWASAKRGQVYKGICVEKMKNKMKFDIHVIKWGWGWGSKNMVYSAYHKLSKKSLKSTHSVIPTCFTFRCRIKKGGQIKGGSPNFLICNKSGGPNKEWGSIFHTFL